MSPEVEEKMPTIEEEEFLRPLETEGPADDHYHIIDSVPDPVPYVQFKDEENDGMRELMAEFDVEDNSAGNFYSPLNHFEN